jgi:hypothetical protein
MFNVEPVPNEVKDSYLRERGIDTYFIIPQKTNGDSNFLSADNHVKVGITSIAVSL